MSKRKDVQARGKYTLEFKMEVVRLVKGGQSVPDTAKILAVPVQTLGNLVRLSEKGELKGAGDKPVSAEQMELARLRAQLARVTMERDILKKATAYFAEEAAVGGVRNFVCEARGDLSTAAGAGLCSDHERPPRCINRVSSYAMAWVNRSW